MTAASPSNVGCSHILCLFDHSCIPAAVLLLLALGVLFWYPHPRYLLQSCWQPCQRSPVAAFCPEQSSSSAEPISRGLVLKGKGGVWP